MGYHHLWMCQKCSINLKHTGGVCQPNDGWRANLGICIILWALHCNLTGISSGQMSMLLLRTKWFFNQAGCLLTDKNLRLLINIAYAYTYISLTSTLQEHMPRLTSTIRSEEWKFQFIPGFTESQTWGKHWDFQPLLALTWQQCMTIQSNSKK